MGILHRCRRKIRTHWLLLQYAWANRIHGESVMEKVFAHDEYESAFVRDMLATFALRRAEITDDILLKQHEIEDMQADIDALRFKSPKSQQEVEHLGRERKAFVQKNTALRGLQNELRNCAAPSEEILRMQYREIISTPRVLAAWIENGHIMIRTDVLYGKDRNWEWRRIGPFLVSFEVLLKSIHSFSWKNLEGVRPGKCHRYVTLASTGGGGWLEAEGLFHGPPNIEDRMAGWGKVNCAGHAAHTFIKGGRLDRDYPTLVQFAVRYPECHGTLNSSVMSSFPIVPVSEVPQWYIETHGA